MRNACRGPISLPLNPPVARAHSEVAPIVTYFTIDKKKMASWERLIRFEDEAGNVHFGEPVFETNDSSSINELADSGKLEARRLVGSDLFSLSASTEVVKVKKLVALLSPRDVPIVKCVGLNYMKHSE